MSRSSLRMQMPMRKTRLQTLLLALTICSQLAWILGSAAPRGFVMNILRISHKFASSPSRSH